MQHALIWSSRRTGMLDEARGWLGSVSFILIFGVMEVSVRSHEQPRAYFWGFWNWYIGVSLELFAK
jgi:hypothetical protein